MTPEENSGVPFLRFPQIQCDSILRALADGRLAAAAADVVEEEPCTRGTTLYPENTCPGNFQQLSKYLSGDILVHHSALHDEHNSANRSDVPEWISIERDDVGL